MHSIHGFQYATCLLFVVSLVGCAGPATTGEVSGTVTVDGQIPAVGSSINFIPVDGNSPTSGALLDQGRYTAQVYLGVSKVEIRVPRPAGSGFSGTNTPEATEGPGAGPGAGQGYIEESLPPKFNNQTELTIEVKPGKNPKDWNLSTQ